MNNTTQNKSINITNTYELNDDSLDPFFFMIMFFFIIITIMNLSIKAQINLIVERKIETLKQEIIDELTFTSVQTIQRDSDV